MVNLGPDTAEIPAKQGKDQQDCNWPHHVDWPRLGENKHSKAWEKTPKGQMVQFSSSHRGILRYQLLFFAFSCYSSLLIATNRY